MANVASVRIAPPNPTETHFINMLSPEERRAALVIAGRVKQGRLDEELRMTMIDRLRRSEIQPIQADPRTGQRYTDLGRRITLPNATGELEDVGRVPAYLDYHVFRAPDGTLSVASSEEVQQRGEHVPA